ncbi:MAG: GNAT family N-acetyltransferase [Defluviitaleaceae bacterium]|nr:GNAT family N-acetyltransferase [Defluviitaleaceae bacterium]
MITMEWFMGDENLADAHYIRRKVFVEEQQISESDEYDGTDGSCVHLVVYDGGAPAGTGRIMITDKDFHIGRVAVLREHRGRGLGVLVMRVLIRAACGMGGERQVLHSQVSAKGFYEKLSFKAVGEIFYEAGIPHIEMEHFGDICVKCEKEK